MAVTDQIITDRYALYNADCCAVLPTLREASVGLSVYSPPFCGLYNYSSSDQDMSNCASYDEFYEHYTYMLRAIHRVTKPGRISAVHCMDIPNPGQQSGYHDLPGNIIRLHQELGFDFFGRVMIWKEPLRVAVRTRLKHLTHKQLVKDSTHSTIAAGDCLLIFKKRGQNMEPVGHEIGFNEYFGATEVPRELMKFKGETDQRKNKLSHWIWRRYASCVWDDIRIDRVLPYKAAREPDDEKHVHPLQLDVIERCVALWSNPGDVVLTPFMGVGSEVYGAVRHGRKAVGIELKSSYYKQALKNVAAAAQGDDPVAPSLFDGVDMGDADYLGNDDHELETEAA